MGKIKVIDHQMNTALPVRNIAVAFRDGIQHPGGLIGFIGRTALDWDFFTPEKGDDPFTALEEVEEPTFTAGASYGLRQRRRITSLEELLQGSVGGAVLLSVWDIGTRRRVEIRHAGDLSPASKRCVQSAIDRMRNADPTLTETETRGKIHR
jgi:hypothetical protein